MLVRILKIVLKIVRWLAVGFSILGLLVFGPKGNVPRAILFTTPAFVAIWASRDWQKRSKLLGSAGLIILLYGITIFSQTPQGKTAYTAEQSEEKQEAATEQKQQQLMALEQARQQKLIVAHNAREQVAAAKQVHQQDIIATQAVNKQVAQQAKADKSAAINTQQKIDDSSTESSGGVDLTYNQVTQYLSDDIAMEETTQIHGQRHFMGQTDDKLAMLEVLGDKSNVSEATLAIGLPDDSREIVRRNSALLLRFILNVAPGWDGANDWTIGAVKEATSSPGESIYTDQGDKRIKMTFAKNIDMLWVNVKHK